MPVSPFAPLAHALLLGGATASVFLAGGALQGSMGVFLVCAGVAMTVCPPRVRVEWPLWAAAAALLACASLALLPEHFLSQPAWRQTLDATPPIVMPGTITTAPALTGFWLAVLAFSVLTGLFTLTQPIRSRWLLAFALTAALTAGIYGALAIYARDTGWHYAFTADATFGFFPNRNHTATLLFVGCLLALGVLGVVLREGRWLAGLLAGAVMAVCGAGLGFYSPTRAGIVFLLAGTVLWMAGLGRTHRDRRLVVSFVALGLASGLLFLLSGGEVRDRLLGRAPATPPTPTTGLTAHTPVMNDPMHGLSTDFRLKIYRDAFDVVHDFPLTGIGLGTFVLVFPQYRHASLSESPAIHPESDWVMFAVEAGTPAALCALVLIGLAAGRLRHGQEHPYWPLRWGCAVAAGAAALHGVIDVPLHRAPLGWWVLAIAGLALQNARTGSLVRSRAQHALFVVGGVAALALGVVLVRAEWFGGPHLPPFAYEGTEAVISRDFKREGAAAFPKARAILRVVPMYPTTYFVYGVVLNQIVGTYPEIEATFQAQRLLDPTWPAVPREQGESWLYDDLERTGTLWLDALARKVRIEQAAGKGTVAAAPFLADLIRRAAAFPELQQRLWEGTAQTPEFLFTWLENASPEAEKQRLALLAVDENFLGRLTAAQHRRFLLAWYYRGDREALTRFLQGRDDTWQEAAWPVRLRTFLDTGQMESAVRAMAGRYAIPLTLPPSGSEGRSEIPTAAQEATDPLGTFMIYWRGGNVVAARRLLDSAATATPPPPPEVWRLRAALGVQDADWATAWRWLSAYARLDHPTNVP